MDLYRIQICSTCIPFEEYEVESSSDPDITYTVTVVDPYDDSPEDDICTCAGFEYRGYCRHLQEIHENLCLWREDIGPESPLNTHKCPRCGRETLTETIAL